MELQKIYVAVVGRAECVGESSGRQQHRIQGTGGLAQI